MIYQFFTVCSALALAVSSAPPPQLQLPAELPTCSCADGAHAACLATVDKWWDAPPVAWPESPCGAQCLDAAGDGGRTARRLAAANHKCLEEVFELTSQCMLEKTRAGTSGCARGVLNDESPLPPSDLGHSHVDFALLQLYDRIGYTGCMESCTLSEPAGFPPPPAGDTDEPYAPPFADECGCLAHWPHADRANCERQVAERRYGGAAMPVCACVAAAVPEAGIDCSAPPPIPQPLPADNNARSECDCANATQAACVKAQRVPVAERHAPPPPLPCHTECEGRTAGYAEVQLLDRATEKCLRRHDEAVAKCINRKIQEGTMGCFTESGPPPDAVYVPTGEDKVWAHSEALEARLGLAQCYDQCFGEPTPVPMSRVHRRSAGAEPAATFVAECGCHSYLDCSACESELPPDSICHCVAEEVTGLDCKLSAPTSEPAYNYYQY